VGIRVGGGSINSVFPSSFFQQQQERRGRRTDGIFGFDNLSESEF